MGASPEACSSQEVFVFRAFGVPHRQEHACQIGARSPLPLPSSTPTRVSSIPFNGTQSSDGVLQAISRPLVDDRGHGLEGNPGLFAQKLSIEPRRAGERQTAVLLPQFLAGSI
jgi:hypothetical protein